MSEEKLSLAKFVLHLADLSHCFKEKIVALRINHLVVREFINQACKEKELKMEETVYFKDLDKHVNFLKSEFLFSSQIISPLLETLQSLVRL